MNVSDFNYNLPEGLIAQTPLEKRDESRLMVLNKKTETIEHKKFKDIIDYLKPGDCLVRNNTKVLPARIYGNKETDQIIITDKTDRSKKSWYNINQYDMARALLALETA